MNQIEWRGISHSSDRPKGFWVFRNQALDYFFNGKRPKGWVIHHLRDTEEQRNFNDQHYERWGIDFDGNMKYCIPMTVEDHQKYHYCGQTKYTSEAVRKRSEKMIGHKFPKSRNDKCSAKTRERWKDPEYKKRFHASASHPRKRTILVERNCILCGKAFMPRCETSKQKYCSKSCSAKHIHNFPEYKEKFKVIAENNWKKEIYREHMIKGLTGRSWKVKH
jgi:hypothetical protein